MAPRASFLTILSVPVMDWVKTDDLSVLLAVALVGVYALAKYLKPHSLVHPLLLGRQADVSRVRMPGESAVYRNYATGIMGRLPERPKPEIRLLGDLIQDANTAPRKLWSTIITPSELKARVEALGNGLTQVAGLVPRESTALLLLDDSLEFLITDLALASHSIVSFTLSSYSLLIPTLEMHAPTAIIVQESFLEPILEHLADLRQSAHHFVIVLGDEKGDSAVQSQRSGIRVVNWADLEAKGKMLPKSNISPPEPTSVFNVFVFADAHGALCGAQLTHANVTAGVTACRLLFPMATPMSSSDTLLSVFSAASPFGRSLAYTALYEGANFVSLSKPPPSDDSLSEMSASSRLMKACETSSASPTLLFVTPEHLKPLTSSILKVASSSLLFGLAWRHKLSGLQEGYVTKLSFWDNLIFNGARNKVLDKLEASLRGIVVTDGPLDVAAIEPARIAFSIPIVCAHSHPLICGPVMVSHPFDLQTFPSDSEPHVTVTHVGPPAPNVEVKLVGVLETSVEKGGDPTGDILVRGPSVASPLPALANPDPEEWVPLHQKARVQTNGTFKIL